MFTLGACGSSSPDNYIEESTRLQCRYLKKCEEELWKEVGFDSVRDCVDTTLDGEILPGTTTRDAFVEGCNDFDSAAARKCLAWSRKAVRSCDLDTSEPPSACLEVCSNPEAAELFTDPANHDLVLEVLGDEGSDGDASVD